MPEIVPHAPPSVVQPALVHDGTSPVTSTSDVGTPSASGSEQSADMIRYRHLARWQKYHQAMAKIPISDEGAHFWQGIYHDLTEGPEIPGKTTYGMHKFSHRWESNYTFPKYRIAAGNLSAEQKAANLAAVTDIDWSEEKTDTTKLPLKVLSSLTHVKSLNLYRNPIRRISHNLPTGLRRLNASYSKLASLGELPLTLEHVNISHSRVSKLSNLPPALTVLEATKCGLASIDGFPQLLETADLAENSLHSLPPLPPKLQKISVFGNRLTELPALSPQLKDLCVGGNHFAALPDLRQETPLLEDLNASSNSSLTAIPALPDSLKRANFNHCGITSLPQTLPRGLEALDLYKNPLGPEAHFPTQAPSLRALTLGSCELRKLPKLPPSLRKLDLGDNPFDARLRFPADFENLTELSFFGCRLRSLSGPFPTGLRRLNLQRNLLGRIPHAWLEASSELEIDLRNNPISPNERRAIEIIVDGRRAEGLPAPMLIFDNRSLRGGRVDDHNLGGLGHTNAHNERIVQIFRNQIAQLKAAQPAAFAAPSINAGDLEARLSSAFDTLTSTPEIKKFAARGLEFLINESETKYAVDEFDQVKPITILHAVEKSIAALPESQRTDALKALQRHLSYAAGAEDNTERCSTRFVEEMLTSLVPYQTATPIISWEIARDAMNEVGKLIVRKLYTAPSSSASTGEIVAKARFQAEFQDQVRADHPNISAAQTERYLNEVLPQWETYKGLATDS